ncbi:hypothetical protein BH23ACT10_BH23ACT10_21630 [soil metagenome]
MRYRTPRSRTPRHAAIASAHSAPLRARLTERDGQTALVLNVPVEVCPSCGQVWLSMPVAKHLDELFNRLLGSGAETAQIHWDQAAAA